MDSTLKLIVLYLIGKSSQREENDENGGVDAAGGADSRAGVCSKQLCILCSRCIWVIINSLLLVVTSTVCKLIW